MFSTIVLGVDSHEGGRGALAIAQHIGDLEGEVLRAQGARARLGVTA
jgi:hypothetical protein